MNNRIEDTNTTNYIKEGIYKMQRQKLENTITITIPFTPKDEFEEVDKAIAGAQEYARRNLGVMTHSMNLSLETLNIGLTVEHGTMKVHIVERYSNKEEEA